MPINLKELAKICNVDISTISRALRDDVRVKISTREQIKKLADELGYLPNIAARNLATGKTNQIMLLVNRLSTNLEMEIAKNLSTLLFEKDIDLVLLQHFDEQKIYKRQLQRLKKNQFDAAIIIPSGQDLTSNIINQFTPAEIPVLLIDRYPENAKIPIITTNNFDATLQLCTTFLQYKLDGILPLFGTHNDVEKKRLAGLIKSAENHQVKVLSENDLTPNHSYQKIALISSTAKSIQQFYENHKSQLEKTELFAGCFDSWAIDSTPYASVSVCIQNFNTITQLALDIILGHPQKIPPVTLISHKEILPIKHYTQPT